MNINSEEFTKLAYSARRNISFFPENWGKAFCEWTREELADDLKHLQDTTGSVGNYETKYMERAVAYLHAVSRCVSPMIVGPANFPVRRSEKAMDSEHRHWVEWQEWRNRYISRATRIPTPSPEAELDIAMIELERAREYHLDLKEHPEKRKSSLSLTNARARVKDLECKIIIMKRRIECKENWKPIEFDGGKIDIENDRVIIKHDERPSQDTINAIKRRGFHWSGRFQCWCRKHTQQAIIDAKRLVGVN